jgi:hypothetical protein
MIAWIAATASAQWFDDPRNDCSASSGLPIAGTAGFDNTMQALRTNASTYSASNFLEKHALRRIAMAPSEQKEVGVAMFEANFIYGVTRIPVFQEDASYGGCPAEYLIATRAVDLYAYNGGGAYRNGRLGVFYSASVTLGYPAELAYLRAYQSTATLMLAPMLLGGAMFGSWQTSSGASSYAQDLVLGAIVDAEVADLRAGYTQSRGWYASAQDHWIGLFGSVVLRDGLQLVGQFRGGAERVKVPGADKVGATSAFARVLPLTEENDGERTEQINLTTGHLEQEDIGGWIDLRAAYAIKPVAQLHEASIALHDPEYYAWMDGEPTSKLRHFYFEAGFVTLPPQYYYGVQGGPKLHLRGEMAFTPQVKDGRLQGSFGFMYNDPEQTALYPFAVDALSGRAQLQGAF